MILILIIALTIGFSSEQTDSKELVNCSFEFEIDQESSLSYRYKSKTGRLSKLIDPFRNQPLYADTVVSIPEKQLCELMKLYAEYKIYDYPDQFKPENGFVFNPEPSYLLKFKYQGEIKEIEWSSNTVIFDNEQASNLIKIIRTIDSLILKTPEFKALPEGQYEWL